MECGCEMKNEENVLLNQPSVVDRYYKRFYKIDNKGHTGEDHCVLVHSNRICVITLAPSHPILQQKKTVTEVNFQINKRTNRLENTLSGKRKRGAQTLADNSALCIVKCSDGSEYQPCACVKGLLIEANDNLVGNPQLVTQKPDTEGYIALVLTKLKEHKQEIGKLLGQEQYDKIVIARESQEEEPGEKRQSAISSKTEGQDGDKNKSTEACNYAGDCSNIKTSKDEIG